MVVGSYFMKGDNYWFVFVNPETYMVQIFHGNFNIYCHRTVKEHIDMWDASRYITESIEHIVRKFQPIGIPPAKSIELVPDLSHGVGTDSEYQEFENCTL